MTEKTVTVLPNPPFTLGCYASRRFPETSTWRIGLAVPSRVYTGENTCSSGTSFALDMDQEVRVGSVN